MIFKGHSIYNVERTGEDHPLITCHFWDLNAIMSDGHRIPLITPYLGKRKQFVRMFLKQQKCFPIMIYML